MASRTRDTWSARGWCLSVTVAAAIAAAFVVVMGDGVPLGVVAAAVVAFYVVSFVIGSRAGLGVSIAATATVWIAVAAYAYWRVAPSCFDGCGYEGPSRSSNSIAALWVGGSLCLACIVGSYGAKWSAGNFHHRVDPPG